MRCARRRWWSSDRRTAQANCNAAAPTGAVSPDFAGGVTIGKRYVDEDSGLEVLGAKAGKGSLAFDGKPLALKGAKPLPASD